MINNQFVDLKVCGITTSDSIITAANNNIKSLGFGPFIASYGLIQTYLRFFPILREILLIICYLIDAFIQIFVNTRLKEIYPIGYFFIIKK